MRKKISIVSGCYNEADNIQPLIHEIIKVLETQLPEYDYEIIIADNDSTDGTREILEEVCSRNSKVRAIFNARNFGADRSGLNAFMQSEGDCAVLMAADFQNPPSMIPDFVKKWEQGYKIVITVKTSAKENPVTYFLRTMYYKFIKRIAEIEHIEHFTGFGLYDGSFVDIVRKLDDPYPYFRGIVSELGFKRAEIPFTQPERKSGKSKSNWYYLYDTAMLGMTSYSKIVMRLATILGFCISGISMLVAIVYFILKLLYWSNFPMGIAPLIISVFFFGSVQLFFIGILGEYIMGINTRSLKRPLVVEERRINFNNNCERKEKEKE